MQPGNIAFDQLEIGEVYRQVLDSRKRSYREILLTSNAVLAGLTLNLSTSKLTSIVKLVKIFSDK